MNLKKLVASLVLLTQATNAFAIGQAGTQVLADKIKSVTGSGTINVNTANTWTIPNATDTAVGKATTDVLTNKSLSTGGTNTVGATTISGVTGSGSLVFGTTPTIGTPAITGGTISGASMTGTTTFPGTSSVDGSGNAIFGGTGNIAGATLIGAAGSADSKSVFELQSTSKGFLPPRMTTAQKNAIASPTTGLVVYDTDLKSIQVYNGTSWVTAGSGGLSYAADTGAANAYAIAPTPAALAYNTGDTYIFKAVNANTTSSTLNVSALGVKNIKTPQVGNLPANAILAGAIVMVVYDGTQFQIISQQDPSRVSPLTTKGDTHTFSTVDARLAVPGDYGRMVPDSNATTGWRPASYTQFQNGAPTKTYIQYADFENNATTGWTATGCATVTSGYPNCPGSGAAAFSSSNGGRTKNANTASPAIDSGSNVSGTYSLNLATTGAGAIGDGYVSSLYTLDPSDRGATFSYRIAYKQASGAPVAGGTATDTYAVAFYDAANNTFLTPSNPFCFTSTSKGFCTGYVNTQTTTTGLQAFVYSPIAPVGASSILLDDFYLGTSILPTGPPIVDEVAYTPAFSAGWGTPTNISFWYSRHGQYLHVRGSFTSGTTTTSIGSISLPTGLAIDNTRITLANTTAASGQQVGLFGGAGNGGQAYIVTALGTSTTLVYMGGEIASTANSLIPVNVSTVQGTGLVSTVDFTVPITGWTSNVSMLSSTSTAPTQQRFTSSSGTYTTPAGAKYIKVRMVGGGGGGGCSGSTAGTAATAGGNTTFGTSLLTANGGAIGQGGSGRFDGGAGGSVTLNSPAFGTSFAGAQGAGNLIISTAATDEIPGGAGGATPFGGAGLPQSISTAAANAVANSGSGGGGGSIGATGGATRTGSGGGAGGFIDATIVNPSPTYAYTVGTGGTGQTLGTAGVAGGNGGSGYIEVTEYYTPNPNVAVDANYVSMGTEGAGTTTLTNASQRNIITTLSAARTYTLPSGGIKAGDQFTITNTADFALTLQSSGANTIEILNIGTINVIANVNTPSAKADWTVDRFVSKTTVASTWTFNGSGSTSGSVNMVLQRDKEMVRIFIPGPVATSGTSSTQFIANTNLPAAFIPAAQVVFPYNSARNNGGAVGAAGAVFLNASGTLTLVRDTGSTAFTNATSCGFQDNFVGNYYLAL